MLLSEITSDIEDQLNDQTSLGVAVESLDSVPEIGPTNKGVWNKIRNVTAVFADLKRSTELNTDNRPEYAAWAYTYFIRAMAIVFSRFDANYIDIHGDGIFGLFSGEDSAFTAIACGVTMKTVIEKQVAVRFRDTVSTAWTLNAGIGIDCGTVMVRRLGLRGEKYNEVWAGKPVNIAAKLSGLAGDNELVVPNYVHRTYDSASRLRRRVLSRTCGCRDGRIGDGVYAPDKQTSLLWTYVKNEGGSLDFMTRYILESKWCDIHGAEFCQILLDNRMSD